MPQFYMFHYGEPFNVTAQLTAQVSAGKGTGGGCDDYSDTATLTGIQVFDASMAPIVGFSIASVSGTLYSADGIVPEPSSLAMAFVGTAILGAILARQRRGAKVR